MRISGQDGWWDRGRAGPPPHCEHSSALLSWRPGDPSQRLEDHPNLTPKCPTQQAPRHTPKWQVVSGVPRGTGDRSCHSPESTFSTRCNRHRKALMPLPKHKTDLKTHRKSTSFS